MGASLTEPGRRTRQRIVVAASELIGERGVAGTTLDDVRAATSSSKSQIYHYFGDKHGLVEAVIDHQTAIVLGAQRDALEAVGDWGDLECWRDSMVAAFEAQGSRGGCPIGTLAAALADTDEQFRTALSAAFTQWRDAIECALARLVENGRLGSGADLQTLATVTLAAIQGGLLLAKTARDSAPLRVAIDGAIAQLQSHSPPGSRGRSRSGGRKWLGGAVGDSVTESGAPSPGRRRKIVSPPVGSQSNATA